MMTRLLRRAAPAAVGVAAVLSAATGPVAAQNSCYPPTPGCATTSSVSATTKVAPTTTVALSTAGGRVPTRTGSLARTGAVVLPTALVGLGLVAAGFFMERSSRRDKTSTTGGRRS